MSRAANWSSKKMATTTTTTTTLTTATKSTTTSSKTTGTATLMVPRYVDSDQLAAELARVGIIVRPMSQRRRRLLGSTNMTGTKVISSAVSRDEINISAEALAASVSVAVRGTNASGSPLVGDAFAPAHAFAETNRGYNDSDSMSLDNDTKTAHPVNITLASLHVHPSAETTRKAKKNASMSNLHIAAQEVDGVSVNGSVPHLHAAMRGIDGFSFNGSVHPMHVVTRGIDGRSVNGSSPQLHAATRAIDGISVNSSMPLRHAAMRGIDAFSANVTEPTIHGLDSRNFSVEEGFSADSGSSSSSSGGRQWAVLGFCFLLGTLALCAGLAGLWMAWTRRSRRSRGTARRTTLMQDNNSNGSNGAIYRALPTEDLDVEERSISSPEQLGQPPWSSVARPPQVGLRPPSASLLSFPLTSLGAATSVLNGAFTAARTTPPVLQTMQLGRPPPAPLTTLAVQQTGTAPVVLQSVVVNGRATSPPRVITTTATQAPTSWMQAPAHPSASWRS